MHLHIVSRSKLNKYFRVPWKEHVFSYGEIIYGFYITIIMVFLSCPRDCSAKVKAQTDTFLVSACYQVEMYWAMLS